MTNDTLRTASRRAVLAASAVLGVGALGTPALAKPPKGVEPADPDVEYVVRKIDGMLATIGKIQRRLERHIDSGECAEEVCETVLANSFLRVWLTTDARDAAVQHEWGAARSDLDEVKGIVEGDIDRLEGVADRGSIGDVLGLERALLNQTVSTLSVMPGDNAT